MALKCAICSTEQQVETVCHHCGKPLCDAHRVTVTNDRAFVDSPFKRFALWLLVGDNTKPEPILVYHCPQCKRKHHFFALVVEYGRESITSVARLFSVVKMLGRQPAKR